MLRNIRVATSSILIAALLVSSFAQAQNGDLFPNIKDPPKINDNGPVTIDETGDEDILPFTPVNPLNPGNQVGPVGPIYGPGVDTMPSYPSRPGRPSPIDNGSINQPPLSGALIRTANVPSQYSCPLFENSTYQGHSNRNNQKELNVM